jgi:peptidoglycan/xylan/chitin deacetylase (PgdA/CDA1 family)
MLHAIGDSDCSEQAFQDQLLFLHHTFRIVPLAEIVSKLMAGECTGYEVAITIDDGLSNTATVVYPFLKTHRIPATVFVCPGLVDQGARLWTGECRERLLFMSPDTLVSFLDAAGRNSGSAEDIITWMKTLPLRKRLDVEDDIRRATPSFRPAPEHRQFTDLMDWDQLRALDPALITIGAHTVTHPILATLSPDEVKHEVCASRTLLEERLDRPVRFFCYPNGAYDAGVLNCVEEHFDGAVTTRAALVRPGIHRYQIPRIPISD